MDFGQNRKRGASVAVSTGSVDEHHLENIQSITETAPTDRQQGINMDQMNELALQTIATNVVLQFHRKFWMTSILRPYVAYLQTGLDFHPWTRSSSINEIKKSRPDTSPPILRETKRERALSNCSTLVFSIRCLTSCFQKLVSFISPLFLLSLPASLCRLA